MKSIVTMLLIIVISISGCTQIQTEQTKVTINDFQSVLDGFEVNGEIPKLLLDENFGGIPDFHILTASWSEISAESHIVLRIRSYTEPSLAQEYYERIKTVSGTLNISISEVIVSGENISRTMSEVPAAMKGKTPIVSYFWVYSNFYFEMQMNSDTDAYKTIVERVVSVYK